VPGVPLPEGDPLLTTAGDASILDSVGPKAPDPEIPGLLINDAPLLLDENANQGSRIFLAEEAALGGRDNHTEGLVLSIGVTEKYSSNLELDETDRLSIFYTSIEPGFSYRSAPSGGATNVLALDYGAGFDIYHDDAVDDATNHRVATILTHNGAKLTAEFTGEYLRSTEASRFTESLSENTTASARLNLNYKLSAKSKLSASANFSRAESDAGASNVSDLFGASLSGLYIYTPKLSLGPSLRFANSDSDATGSISSVALGADVRYRPTQKIFLQSTFGVESVDLAQNDSETSPTSTFSAQYSPNPVWSFKGEVRYEAIPINSRSSSTIGRLPGQDPLERLNGPSSDGDQQLNTSLSVNYTPGNDWRINATFNHRTSPSIINLGESIADSSIGLGVSRSFGKSELSLRLSNSTTEFEGLALGTDGTGGDQEFQQIALYYDYPGLFNGFDLNAGISYLENTGSRKYDEIGVSISANYRF
ncbi:hypothetical protein N9W62_10450, partial [Akkermansiaceae bacterium]|nr:hypothetical protein [Akkermansiaceae bacterium]